MGALGGLIVAFVVPRWQITSIMGTTPEEGEPSPLRSALSLDWNTRVTDGTGLQ